MPDESTVLVTGADGFTGRHICRFLNDCGYKTVGTSREDKEGYVLCDIADHIQISRVVADTQPDFVIHLAGISYTGHNSIETYYQVNTAGTQWLLDALEEHVSDRVQKVLIASSAAVYGPQDTDVLDENLCPRPASHYGISKLAAEHAARAFFDKLPVVIVRPFNYTGAGQPDRFVIPKIVDAFKRGDKGIELGNIEVVREFNDVQVACHVYEALLRSSISGEIVNLCTGRGVSLSKVVENLEKMSGSEMEITVNPAFVRPNDPPLLVGSPDKLKKHIGDLPEVSLEETLVRMLSA